MRESLSETLDSESGLSIDMFSLWFFIISAYSVAVWRQSIMSQYRDGQAAKM
jgi:hypothetical protein